MKLPLTLPLLLASVSLASAATFWGVTDSNNLVSFDSTSPSSFLSSVSITGLVAPDGVTTDPLAFIVNLSFNPTTGEFTGIDTNANIYRIGLSGNASIINNTFSPAGFDAGLAYDPFSGGFVFADDAASRFNITNAGIATLIGTAISEQDLPTIQSATLSWYSQDPTAARNWLASQPTLTDLQPAISYIALKITDQGDLTTAIQWATLLSEDTLREDTLLHIHALALQNGQTTLSEIDLSPIPPHRRAEILSGAAGD